MALNQNILDKVKKKSSSEEERTIIISVLETAESGGYGKSVLKKIMNVKKPMK